MTTTIHTTVTTTAPHPTHTGAALAPTEPTPLDAALAGLAASRARLRAGLMPPINPPAPLLDAQGRPQTGGWPSSLAAWWRRGRRALRAWPVADLAAGLLQDWWQRHPWRGSSEQLAESARQAVLPLVRRHPLSALLAATALGAALVATRPWRWRALRPARPAARHSTRHWLAAQLANPAVQTALLSSVMLIVKQWTEAQATRPAAPATPSPSTAAAPVPSPAPASAPSSAPAAAPASPA